MRRRLWLWSLALALGAATLLPPAPARALAQGDATATITILAGLVEVQSRSDGPYLRATDGQRVREGVRLRTRSDARASLTFADGTTATLLPGTELFLERVDPRGSRGGLFVGIELTAGRVWAQVSSLFDRGASFEVRAGSATAVAFEGTTGFRIDPDGTVICWTISGEPLRLQTAGGEIVLAAGQQVTVAPDGLAAPVIPRAFGPGRLEVRADGVLLPRLVDPNGLSVGFPRLDLAVNQVLDATTSVPAPTDRAIWIPGPVAGRYQLVLDADAGGPYYLTLVVTRGVQEVARQEWRGDAVAGEPRIVELTLTVDDGGPTSATFGEVRPLVGPAPGGFAIP